MTSDPRLSRIVAECLEPPERLAALGIRRAIVAFGSSRLPADDPACRDAAAVGEALARWTRATHAPADRYAICTGGGPGVMEAVAAGVARVDRTLNLAFHIPLSGNERANGHVDAERVLDFQHYFMRKFRFLELAHAAVVFPGGIGTVDELFEVLALAQTGQTRPMPIVLYDRAFWEEVVDFGPLVRRGLVRREDLALFGHADTPEEALEQVVRALTGPR